MCRDAVPGCKMLLVAALVWGVLGFAQISEATSCRPRVERYFLSCRDGVCENVFRVIQVNAFGMCGRRSDILETDAATSHFLTPLIEHAKPHATGLFELKFPNMYWYEDYEDAFKTLRLNLDATLSRRDQKEPRSVASMPPDEVAELLNKAYGDRWIGQISSDPSTEMVQAERHRLERTAQWERWQSASLWAADWASALAVLAAFIYSIHLFFFRLYSATAAKSSLLVPVAIQVIIGAMGIGAFAVVPQEFWPGSVLLPAIVTVLLAEGWARVWKV